MIDFFFEKMAMTFRIKTGNKEKRKDKEDEEEAENDERKERKKEKEAVQSRRK